MTCLAARRDARNARATKHPPARSYLPDERVCDPLEHPARCLHTDPDVNQNRHGPARPKATNEPTSHPGRPPPPSRTTCHHRPGSGAKPQTPPTPPPTRCPLPVKSVRVIRDPVRARICATEVCLGPVELRLSTARHRHDLPRPAQRRRRPASSRPDLHAFGWPGDELQWHTDTPRWPRTATTDQCPRRSPRRRRRGAGDGSLGGGAWVRSAWRLLGVGGEPLVDRVVLDGGEHGGGLFVVELHCGAGEGLQACGRVGHGRIRDVGGLDAADGEG